MQPAASLSPAAKAKAEAQARAAASRDEHRRASEAANLRRFGETVRDLRAFGQVVNRGERETAADGSAVLILQFRDAKAADMAGDAIWGAWPE